MSKASFVRYLYRFQQRIGLTAPEFRAVCLFAGLLLTGSIVEHVRYGLLPVDPEIRARTDAYFFERAATAGLLPTAPTEPVALPEAAAPDSTPAPRSEAPAATRRQTVPEPAGPVDINRADATDLETLPGIGPALARRILEFRERNGAFTYVEDLLLIRGIGEKTLERIAPYVTVDGAPLPDETVADES